MTVRKVTPVTPSEGARVSQGIPPAPTDEEVVRRVVAGEVALFELLMRRHNRVVFRAARAILSSDDEAEDVMQHAYVRAFEHLHEFEARSLFSTWLIRIAIHEALARARRLRGLTGLEEESEEATKPASRIERTPECETSDRELRGLLECAIAELPVDFRLVFVLRAIEQLSVLQVSEVLNIPEKTVRTRFFRARLRLQQRLLERLDMALDEVFAFHLVRCDRVVGAVWRRLEAG